MLKNFCEERHSESLIVSISSIDISFNTTLRALPLLCDLCVLNKATQRTQSSAEFVKKKSCIEVDI
jgi:hypothetical protein